jgi:hypothetical protein
MPNLQIRGASAGHLGNRSVEIVFSKNGPEADPAVHESRTINTTLPLTGGGPLSSDLTLGINPATDLTPGSMSAADKTKLDGLPASLYPVPDNIFGVSSVGDATKLLHVDASGQTTGTTATITLTGTISRPFRLPDISGTAVVQEDSTGIVFLGQGGQFPNPLGPSASRVQLSSLVPSGPQFRGNQFGANAGVPGISTFKSRGVTVGALAPVTPGDVIFRATAVGVTSNLSVPLGGLISIQIPSGGVPIGAGWVATEYELQVVPLAGPANGRRISFKVTSEGETQSLRGVRAGSETATIPAGSAAAAIAVGALWSSGTGDPNGVLTGSPGDLYSRKDGGAGTSFYVKESGTATNTGWVPK